MRIFHAEDEHVLRHPTLVARDVGSDAQCKTFLAQQRVAAIAGTVRPDLAGLGKMDNVFFPIAGPGDIFLSGSQRGAHAVDAGHDALLILVNFLEDVDPDASHDSHVHDHIRRISKLHADLRHGPAHGPML